MAVQKTNAMRILEKAGVKYQVNLYPSDGFTDGAEVARKCGIPPEICFKTLVAFHKEANGRTEYFVFVIPVDKELDLKAAAASVGRKNAAMLPLKELLQVTGYVRGGCSPVGMKKLFPTVIDSSAQDKEEIYVSGGKVGIQIRLSPKVLSEIVGGIFGDITV